MQVADTALWLPGDGSVDSGPAQWVLSRADVTPPLVSLARRFGWTSVPLSVREARRRIADHGPHLDLPDAPPFTEAVSWDSSCPIASTGDLTVRYGDLVALSSVDITLDAGVAVAVMGRNGSGKSSLLWALQGAVPSSGRVDVDGRDPRKVSDDEARGLVSLVPQAPSDLLYLPTVADECLQADRESGVAHGTTADLLRQLGAPLPPERNPRDLSEGQRLALVLAIQMAASPRIICLDEPTRGLDYAMKRRLVAIIDHLISTGVCVVIATHDVEFAAAATQRTIVLAEGEVVADGATRHVCGSSHSFAPQLSKVFHPADVMTIDDVRRAMR